MKSEVFVAFHRLYLKEMDFSFTQYCVFYWGSFVDILKDKAKRTT